MNKFWKSLIAILGATEVVFDIFIPIAVSLLVIKVVGLDGWKVSVLLIAGIISSMYRATDLATLKN